MYVHSFVTIYILVVWMFIAIYIYEKVARYLVARGFAVFLYDHQVTGAIYYIYT